MIPTNTSVSIAISVDVSSLPRVKFGNLNGFAIYRCDPTTGIPFSSAVVRLADSGSGTGADQFPGDFIFSAALALVSSVPDEVFAFQAVPVFNDTEDRFGLGRHLVMTKLNAVTSYQGNGTIVMDGGGNFTLETLSGVSLIITYSWPADIPDLDTGTEFLGSTVGYDCGYVSRYFNFSGDNTDLGGSETVIVLLGKFYDETNYTRGTENIINLNAGWYTGKNGTGPALVSIYVEQNDASNDKIWRSTTLTTAINPGYQNSCASTKVATVTVVDDGQNVTFILTPYNSPNIPSITPSTSPIPNEGPSNSDSPSNVPSISHVPSNNPSMSSVPSEGPSNSYSPSEFPSTSLVPSIKPSMSPLPSEEPSNSYSPSDVPSISAIPSNNPSASIIPSEVPSTSLVPSIKPSMSPLPSEEPSNSYSPSDGSSISHVPSNIPSVSMIPSYNPRNSFQFDPEMIPTNTSVSIAISVDVSSLPRVKFGNLNGFAIYRCDPTTGIPFSSAVVRLADSGSGTGADQFPGDFIFSAALALVSSVPDEVFAFQAVPVFNDTEDRFGLGRHLVMTKLNAVTSYQGNGTIVMDGGGNFTLETLSGVSLIITYSWPADIPDLDTGTEFLGSTVGYDCGYVSRYFNFSGDNTDLGGSETVIVLLGKFYDETNYTRGTENIINLNAGWYTGKNGTGPALVSIYVEQNDASNDKIWRSTTLTTAINPGYQNSCASTKVATVTDRKSVV